MKSIADFMGQDHDRLDQLFTDFQTLKGSDFQSAKDCFVEFKQGLQRHIVWEEDVLFPVFEGRTDMGDRGPTAVMRMEHRRIKDWLEQIHDRIAAGRADTDEFEQGLLLILAAHNKKEETVLYLWIDQCLSGQEADEIIARMIELPAERYHQCCGYPDH
jgi:hemerythrin-like domain-containing protein